jgi:hypothetical protein
LQEGNLIVSRTKSNALAIVPKPTAKSAQPLGSSKRSIGVVKREIAAAEAGLERAQKDFWKATSALTTKGIGVQKTVTDSKGESFKALRVNPHVRVLDAARKTRKIFTLQLEQLRAELAVLQAPKVTADDTDEFFEDENQ